VIDHPKTNFATTLRGLAAISVVALHAGIQRPLTESSFFPDSGIGFVNRVVELGSAGPAVFFVSSGFVLSLVWQKSQTRGYAHFALRRFLRLTPLYFVVLFYLLIFQDLELFDLILRIMYLDAFLPQLFSRDPIGVLWTISVEFWCSLLVPFLVPLLKSRLRFHWLLFFFLFRLIHRFF
jgi:peptidoglycan/LPS O-acetylase OafA/YrhL